MMSPTLAVGVVFIGCCLNVVFLELLIKEDSGCGNLITFAQFVVIAAEGFCTTMNFARTSLKVPIQEYTKLVVMFFVVSVTNNYALGFNISLPLHMIFRAGSLMANMILGIILLKKTYILSKYVSVLMISVGIFLCTLASSKDVGKDSLDTDSQWLDFFWWIIGISLLTFALFMSARMGVSQEVMYAKYGKHPREALFFTHALPLPGFLLLYRDLATHIAIANQSAPLDWASFNALPLIGSWPRIWVYLLGNVITQSICINAVFVLTTECSSLTVTLVVTLRKFLSLLFSIWYFSNPFTVYHWIGTAMVFLGTALFSDIPNLLRLRKPKTKAN